MDATEIKEALQVKFDEFTGKTVKPEQLESLKTAFNDTIEKKFSELGDNDALKKMTEDHKKQMDEMKADFQKKFDDQEEILKKQGEELGKYKAQVIQKSNPLAEFEAKFKDVLGEDGGAEGFKRHDEVRFSFKVDNPQTFTTEDVAAGVYPDGTTANATATVFNQETNISGRVYEAPKRVPSFLSGIRTEPISGGQLGAVVKVSEVGDAAVVDECAVKPYANISFDIEYSKAGTIAVLWKESRQWRNDLNRLIPAVRRHMNELMARKIERVMFDGDASLGGFKTYAGAFVPQTGLSFPTPTKLEAIGATIYSLQTLEFMPTTVIVHPIDYATMVHSRASDGHYDILNNGSIQLINGNTIISGSNVVGLTVSTLATPGEFFVGDMSEAIVGLGGTVEFSQGFVNDDFERNLITNRLEIDAALLIPTVVRGAFVNSTYAAVLPQITA